MLFHSKKSQVATKRRVAPGGDEGLGRTRASPGQAVADVEDLLELRAHNRLAADAVAARVDHARGSGSLVGGFVAEEDSDDRVDGGLDVADAVLRARGVVTDVRHLAVRAVVREVRVVASVAGDGVEGVLAAFSDRHGDREGRLKRVGRVAGVVGAVVRVIDAGDRALGIPARKGFAVAGTYWLTLIAGTTMTMLSTLTSQELMPSTLASIRGNRVVAGLDAAGGYVHRVQLAHVGGAVRGEGAGLGVPLAEFDVVRAVEDDVLAVGFVGLGIEDVPSRAVVTLVVRS